MQFSKTLGGFLLKVNASLVALVHRDLVGIIKMTYLLFNIPSWNF